jgi:hypothetical protein
MIRNRNNVTIKEATEHWIRGFNAIPQSFITEALGERLYDSFVEQYPNLKVCQYCSEQFTEEEYEELLEKADGDENEVACPKCEGHERGYGLVDYIEDSHERHDFLPMWGTMWTMEDSSDERWIEGNLETMYQIGFRVYEHEDLGIVIGIDGAGYDFYEAHWIKFYKARGLQWHDVEGE